MTIATTEGIAAQQPLYFRDTHMPHAYPHMVKIH